MSPGLCYLVMSCKHPPPTLHKYSFTFFWLVGFLGVFFLVLVCLVGFFHTKVKTRKQNHLPPQVNFLPNILAQRPRLGSSTQPLLTLLQARRGSVPSPPLSSWGPAVSPSRWRLYPAPAETDGFVTTAATDLMRSGILLSSFVTIQ